MSATAERERREAPELADGIELLGEYEDSGYKEPHYVARRADGQVLQLSGVLQAIAERADGTRGYRELAQAASEELGRKVTAENARFLVEKKLRPMGVLAAADGTSPQLPKADPLLALKFRAAVVPERLTRALTTVFRPLFLPPVIVAALVALVAVDVWFFFAHGVAQPTRELLYNPLLLLMVLGLVVVATAFHELGHATALRYGGGSPGVMGAGVYVVWPAFYTDVTDAYRLGRGGRLRTDLGGVYFNALFVLAIAAAYALTGFEPLLVLVVIQHVQVLQQLLPILRLDGYYVLSDLTGVPDLFARIRPTLRSVLPRARRDARVEELKPRVRVITTGWVVLLIPTLVLVFGLMLLNAPRMIATGWDSLLVHADRVAGAWDKGHTLTVVVGAVQIVTLLLPTAGLTYSFGRLAKRVGGWALSWSRCSALRRVLLAAAAAGALAGAAYLFWPNGEYEPIRPDERGTLQGGLLQLDDLAGGRPGLTAERERELDEAVAPSVPAVPPRSRPAREEPAGRPAPPPPPPPAAAPRDEPAPTPQPRARVETPGTTVQAPAATVETPAGSVGTPGATVSVPGATVQTPTVEVPPVPAPEAPAATVETPAGTVETPEVPLPQPGVTVETPELPPPPVPLPGG